MQLTDLILAPYRHRASRAGDVRQIALAPYNRYGRIGIRSPFVRPKLIGGGKPGSRLQYCA